MPLDDPDQQEKVLQAIANGLSPRAAANLLGLHLQTLKRFLRERPDFQDRFCQAKAKHEAELLASIRNAPKTNWRTAARFLEREDPQAFRLGPDYISLDEFLHLFASLVNAAIRYISDPKAQVLFLSDVDRLLRISGLADDRRFQDVLRRHLPADAARDHFDPANGDSSDQ